MHYKQLLPQLSRSSQLAFGCAGVSGRVSKRNSISIINTALDLGISHFDVAPSYGYGDAESCLGNAVKLHRQKIVIATKTGILPARPFFLFKKLKPLAQQVICAFPRIQTIVSKSTQFVGAPVLTNQFTFEKIKTSVENSLLYLRTDYIDILFLHECSEENLSFELIDFLESLKKIGKILSYGLATTIKTIHDIQVIKNRNFLVQFQNNILLNNQQKLKNNNSYITHGSFSCFDQIKTIVMNNEKELRRLDLWPLQSEDLYELMLRYATLVNKNGVVICSMLNDQHLRKNVTTIETPRFSEQQVMDFARMICMRPNEIGQSILL